MLLGGTTSCLLPKPHTLLYNVCFLGVYPRPEGDKEALYKTVRGEGDGIYHGLLQEEIFIDFKDRSP
jgi:hypothetical protein